MNQATIWSPQVERENLGSQQRDSFWEEPSPALGPLSSPKIIFSQKLKPTSHPPGPDLAGQHKNPNKTQTLGGAGVGNGTTELVVLVPCPSLSIRGLRQGLFM